MAAAAATLRRCRTCLSTPVHRRLCTAGNDTPSALNAGLRGLGGLDLGGADDGAQSTRRVVIDAIGSHSFTISGVRVQGSVLLLPHFSTFWNVNAMRDAQPPAFALVKLMHPRPDILILGTGAESKPVGRELYAFFKEIGVNFEAMDTKNACHTFNVLNQESRNVSAALLPCGWREIGTGNASV